jgi:hypothetical protein
MYKTATHTPRLKEILDRAAGKVVPVVSVVYSNSDIQRARSVLDRLLQHSQQAEVSSVRNLPKQLQER